MNLISAVLLSAFISSSYAKSEWISALLPPNGWNMGNGLHLQIAQTDNESENATSFVDNHQLRFNLNGYGFSVGKAPEKEAVQFGFISNPQPEQFQGREKKETVAYVIMGYKMATIVTMVLGTMGALVLKALGVAKMALVTSAIIFIIKLFHHEKGHHHHNQYLEVEHTPEHSEVAPEIAAGGYHSSGAENLYSYANYAPSAAADNSVGFGGLDAAANSSVAGGGGTGVAVGRRRDISRRKSKQPLYTIHRYTVGS